ncbi:MAG TPA: hypothetical protein VEW25_11710 [Allosphingosinicella sp.]|nr:hypothetical protein [Allosphingosinicella sp.]
MTRHAPLQAAPAGDAPRQLAQLRRVLRLVEQIAGRPAGDRGPEAELDEAARTGSAYGDTLPIVQRRFDALVAETAGWAAAGVEALTRAGGSTAAAARLAEELGDAIAELTKLLKLQN